MPTKPLPPNPPPIRCDRCGHAPWYDCWKRHERRDDWICAAAVFALCVCVALEAWAVWP